MQRPSYACVGSCVFIFVNPWTLWTQILVVMCKYKEQERSTVFILKCVFLLCLFIHHILLLVVILVWFVAGKRDPFWSRCITYDIPSFHPLTIFTLELNLCSWNFTDELAEPMKYWRVRSHWQAGWGEFMSKAKLQIHRHPNRSVLQKKALIKISLKWDGEIASILPSITMKS